MRHKTILEISNLSVTAKIGGMSARVVSNMGFKLEQGGILGIVGEKGSGKEFFPKALLGLLEGEGFTIAGEALFMDEDMLTMDEHEIAKLRGREISYVFGSARSALNPHVKIGRQLDELARHYETPGGRAAFDEVLENLGVEDTRRIRKSYADQLDDGLVYRSVLAMAAIARPKILIVEEPAQEFDGMDKKEMLVLLKRICIDYRISIILLTRDFEAARLLCDRIVIMYRGLVVEEAPVRCFIGGASHPYTVGLVRSFETAVVSGESTYSIPGGESREGCNVSRCPFIERCSRRIYACARGMPALSGEGMHRVRCFNPVEGADDE